MISLKNTTRALSSAGIILGQLFSGANSFAADQINPTDRTTEYTPLIESSMTRPIPFLGTDRKYHLVFETRLINSCGSKVQLKKFEVVDADKRERKLLELNAPGFSSCIVSLGSRKPIHEFAPNEAGVVFAYLDFAEKSDIPRALICVTSSHCLKSEAPLPDTIVVSGAEVVVDNAKITEYAPPLEGKRWVAMNGCSPTSPHRRAIIPLNNNDWISQRFAIDYMQLTEDGRIFDGSAKKCESYPCYDKKALAVADATVVEAVDQYQNQIPGSVKNLTVPGIAGNHVVLDFGNGECALYAHLKPGTVKVKAGQHVAKGDELGRVGNTGNTSAPHLHFHVMHGFQPLVGSGVPYYPTPFNYNGAITLENFFAALKNGKIATVSDTEHKGSRSGELPMAGALIDF